eukprot:5144218-Amphidinium_carterae.1
MDLSIAVNQRNHKETTAKLIEGITNAILKQGWMPSLPRWLIDLILLCLADTRAFVIRAIPFEKLVDNCL